MQEFAQTRNGQVFLNNVGRIASALEKLSTLPGSVDTLALDTIAEVLSSSWDADTLERVAELVRGTGRVIRDSDG